MNNDIRVGLIRACRRVSLCPLVVLLIWTRKCRELLCNRLCDDEHPIGSSEYDTPASLLSISLYWIMFYLVIPNSMIFGTTLIKWVCTACFLTVSIPTFVAGLDLFHYDGDRSGKMLTDRGLAKSILMTLAVVGSIVAIPMILLYTILFMIVCTVCDPVFKQGDRILNTVMSISFASWIGLTLYGLMCDSPITAVIGIYATVATLICLFCFVPTFILAANKLDDIGVSGIDILD